MADSDPPSPAASPVSRRRLFFCGDIMTGRGIDQILAHPADPALAEPYIDTAVAYVELAERRCGPIQRPVDDAYVWGDALKVWRDRQADVRIGNLETAVTTSVDISAKAVNYRMNPANLGCLKAGGFDCVSLANNHSLDWGIAGLRETIESLRAVGLPAVGAGRDLVEAAAPAVLPCSGGRVLVLGAALGSSGVPAGWAAGPGRPGVHLLPDLSDATAASVARRVAAVKKPGDTGVFSLHWGGNWGYAVSNAERRFAHALIDDGLIDIVHGHSSHHAKGIEVYRGRLILYGCGDFFNDYEGIGGHEAYRDDLALMYFADVERMTGRLLGLDMVPMKIARFRLNKAQRHERETLCAILDRESARFRARVRVDRKGSLVLRW